MSQKEERWERERKEIMGRVEKLEKEGRDREERMMGMKRSVEEVVERGRSSKEENRMGELGEIQKREVWQVGEKVEDLIRCR
ncbi:hypothetical protein DMN91_001599 [Ooceraea biroi]|uniref:Uncharacterized protein n=1 Tax=Ooceraea biroi TaxID=2015173 RepID=A0A3L8DYZ3_OOCBI|nr:hypothetical protein DMN91_001599 [Ooceraea biroi]